MKKIFGLLVISFGLIGSSCQSTNPTQTTTAAPQYDFPTVEEYGQLADQLGRTDFSDDETVVTLTEAERYYNYGQMLSLKDGKEYELGILEISYDPNLTLQEVEQKLTDQGFMVYNVLSKELEMAQVFGGTGIFGNSVRILKIPGVTVYDSETCSAEAEKFATDNNFEPLSDSKLNDKFFVPMSATLEELMQLMDPTNYPCLNQHDWKLTETNRNTQHLDRIFITGQSHIGLGLPSPTAEQLAIVQTVVDELNTLPEFTECSVNDRGIGLATCSYGDVGQADISSLLEKHGLTDYSFTNMTFTYVLVPYYEEAQWAEQLKTWPEIVSVGFNYLLESQ